MRKRLINIYIVAIIVFGICGCTQTAGDMFDAEAEPIADAAEQEEQATGNPVSQDESESEKEINYDGLNTYIPILKEYERAWEDETYTIEELQNVAGVFITLTDAKFRFGTKEKDYTLYYSMSDLEGDGSEELIIGIRGEDGIAPCFLYTGEGERIHITDSRTWSDLVEKPTILYENGIVESTEYVKYGMYRYNFYQLNHLYTSSDWIGRMELIDSYFYIEDSGNGTRYYKGDMVNPVTEEEFWNGIGDYESMPQIKLDWHELEGFWEQDEKDIGRTVIGEEYRQSEKEKKTEDEEKSKKDDSVTVVAKETFYYSDGSVDYWNEYEYDSAGNSVKRTNYNADGSIDSWYEYEYDGAGNEVKYVCYFDDERVDRWGEKKYDSAGNIVMLISYNADGSIEDWYGWEYDSAGNMVKNVCFRPKGKVTNWSEWEYDSAGNEVKYIRYYSDGTVDSWSENEYDSAGKLIKETRYTDSINFYWNEYEYDNAGNKVKEVVYEKSNGDIFGWYEWEYDSLGNKVKYIEYEADGGIRYRSEYEYDSAGNETKWIDYYGDDSAAYWNEYEYEYDGTGNLVKKIEYEPDGGYEFEYITMTPQ